MTMSKIDQMAKLNIMGVELGFPVHSSGLSVLVHCKGEVEVQTNFAAFSHS